jgi:hypothetical protein
MQFLSGKIRYASQSSLDKGLFFFFFFSCSILNHRQQGTTEREYVNTTAGTTTVTGDEQEERPADLYTLNVVLAFQADVQEANTSRNTNQGAAIPTSDLWEDLLVIEFLEKGSFSGNKGSAASLAEKNRASKRAQMYRMQGGVLARRMGQQGWKVVPKPEERKNIVKQLHEETGHFGRKRTTHLILLTYWWKGLFADVRKVLQQCEACQHTMAVFNSQRPELQCLPIAGMFYRWHVDTCGPFNSSLRGNTYLQVAVEAYSKQVEIQPMPSKKASEQAYAFLANVMQVWWMR